MATSWRQTADGRWVPDEGKQGRVRHMRDAPTNSPRKSTAGAERTPLPRAAVAARIQGLSIPQSTPRRTSGRIGSIGGHPTRSFTIGVRPAETPAVLTAYVHRLARGAAEEIEAASHTAPQARVWARETQALQARLETAPDLKFRRAMYSTIIELPYEGDRDYRTAVLTRVARSIEARGYSTTWAIHTTSSTGAEYPHAHLLLRAGEDGARPIDGSADMKLFRAAVADAVNQEFIARFGRRLEVEYHGGTLADTGITRAARRDIPRGLYRTREAVRAAERAGQPITKRQAQLASAADRIEQQTAEQSPRAKQARASAGQRRLIQTIARAAGIEVDEAEYDLYSGGDLMGAVRAAGRADRADAAQVYAEYLAARVALLQTTVQSAERTVAAVQAERARIVSAVTAEAATARVERDMAQAALAEAQRTIAGVREDQARTVSAVIAEATTARGERDMAKAALAEAQRAIAGVREERAQAVSAVIAEATTARGALETAHAEKSAAEADRDAARAEVTRISEAMQQRSRRYMDASQAQADAADASRRQIAQLSAERDALAGELAASRHQATQPAAPPITQADRPRPQPVVALHGTHTAAHQEWVAGVRRDLAHGGEAELRRYLDEVTQARAATDPLRTTQLAAWDRTRAVVLQAAADLGLQPPGQRQAAPAPTQGKTPGRGRGG